MVASVPFGQALPFGDGLAMRVERAPAVGTVIQFVDPMNDRQPAVGRRDVDGVLGWQNPAWHLARGHGTQSHKKEKSHGATSLRVFRATL